MPPKVTNVEEVAGETILFHDITGNSKAYVLLKEVGGNKLFVRCDTCSTLVSITAQRKTTWLSQHYQGGKCSAAAAARDKRLFQRAVVTGATAAVEETFGTRLNMGQDKSQSAGKVVYVSLLVF